MKLKDIFDIKNVSNFIEGHAKYIYDRIIGLPKHQQEQMLWRLSICKDDCLVTGECIICKCPPEKKATTISSCNPERFPDMMDEEQWNEYKEVNNIE
jgi:hypothetical protein